MLRDPSIISGSPEIMGSTPVFAGTRVPVQTLLDYLKAGESIACFCHGGLGVFRKPEFRHNSDCFLLNAGLDKDHLSPSMLAAFGVCDI